MRAVATVATVRPATPPNLFMNNQIIDGVAQRCCEGCGIEMDRFERKNKKYCTTECRKRFEKNGYQPVVRVGPQVSTGVRGAINELIVCADLMNRGYSVFRSVSQSCSCDLIAMKPNVNLPVQQQNYLRVEVTTATRTKKGDAVFAPHDPDAYDLLALVFVDGEIEYRPKL